MEGLRMRISSNCDENPQPEQAVECQDEDDDEKPDMSTSMTENVYSLIFIADSTSAAFWISMLCVVFQLTMICLVLADMIKPNNTENPLGAPNNVSGVVRVAGFMSLLLSVALFWDLMDAVDKLIRDPVAFSQQSHRERHIKFYFAFTLQLAIGFLFLFTIFILIVRSTDVLGMFLNYAAMQFITEVDDVVFKVAALGYVGKSMKKECENVADFKLPPVKKPVFRHIIFYLVTILLVISYSIIWGIQSSGKFDCQRIEVQFGDGFIPYLPVFSGYYTYHAEFYHGRPIYKDETGKAIFRYCRGGGSGYWVFGWFSPVTGIHEMDDLCTNFVSRTPETSGFGILDTPGSDWLIKRELGIKLEIPVDHFFLACADCDETTCTGSCQDNSCVCGESEYGNNCQFNRKACGMVDYDRNTNKFYGSGYFHSSNYTLLKKSDDEPATKYGRPLYAYFYSKNEYWFGYADVLMNMGRRFAIISVNINYTNRTPLFPNATNTHFELANYLEDVHPWYDWWEEIMVASVALNYDYCDICPPVYISSPIDVGTTSDSFSPAGLTWSRTSHNSLPLTPLTPISTILICAKCSDSYLCEASGTCNNETSTCNCTSGFEGTMCEKEPPCVLGGDCR